MLQIVRSQNEREGGSKCISRVAEAKARSRFFIQSIEALRQGARPSMAKENCFLQLRCGCVRSSLVPG